MSQDSLNQVTNNVKSRNDLIERGFSPLMLHMRMANRTSQQYHPSTT